MKNYMIFLWIASIAIAIISGIVVYRSIKNDKHMNLAYFMVLLSGFVIIITSYCHWATNQYTYGMNYEHKGELTPNFVCGFGKAKHSRYALS